MELGELEEELPEWTVVKVGELLGQEAATHEW